MPSLLQQLENNEAVLLMYLAGELPLEDREEVEQMLAVDANLRSELNQLREMDASFSTVMSESDYATPMPVSESAAIRRASRAIRQWQTTRAVRPAAPVEVKRGLRYAWWFYPLSSAAVLLLAYVVWWGNRTDRGDNHFQFGPDNGTEFATDDAQQDAEEESPNIESTDIEHTELARGNVSLVGLNGLQEGSDDALSNAERQLRALVAIAPVGQEPMNLYMRPSMGSNP